MNIRGLHGRRTVNENQLSAGRDTGKRILPLCTDVISKVGSSEI